MHTPLRMTLACLGAATLSAAQELHFNEIYASMASTDTSEYIELIGTAGMSLDGWMVVVVDGDGLGAGVLDRAWDLTGYVVPGDGYFVMGDAAVATLDYDLALGPHQGGATDNLENGTQTYYLLQTTDVPFVEGLYGQDIDADGDLVTDLAQASSVTLREVVGVWDEDGPGNGEELYDQALALGPDLSGPFEPPGIFRPTDYPSCWCSDVWLDFQGSGLTPGSANPASSCTPADCGGGGGPIGTNYCGPANLNSSGMSAVISGLGSTVVADNDVTLTGMQMPPGQFAMLIVSQTQGLANPPGSQGILCIGGNIGRYKTQITNTGAAGMVTISADLTHTPVNPPVSIQPGETWNWQIWFRDANPMATSNFTDGLSVTFQ